MVAIIIGREFAVTGLRSLAHARGFTIPPSRLGKLKMSLQVATILLLIVGWGPLPMLAPIGRVMLWVVLFAAIVSGLDYYQRFQRLLSARVTDVSVARSRAEVGARKVG
jgi:CDP-diacylglycerol--glycerol-3-phosphate 3-phosphatidyltransferase